MKVKCFNKFNELSQEKNETGNEEKVDTMKAGVTHKKSKHVNSKRTDHLLSNTLQGRGV